MEKSLLLEKGRGQKRSRTDLRRPDGHLFQWFKSEARAVWTCESRQGGSRLKKVVNWID